MLAGAEIAARVVTRGGAAAARAERHALLERIPGAAAGGDEHDPGALAFQAESAGFQLHPFFGYTARRDANGANNQGFFGGGASYPYRKEPGEFVIALFGGSVAGQLYGFKQIFVDRLSPALRAKGYDSVRVISFALSGWRQPQLFFAFVSFLNSFDMAVNLDGFNEVIHTGDGELGFYPADFPFSAVYAPLASRAGSAEGIERMAELIRANRSMASLTRALDRAPLRYSVLAHLGWRVAAARYERRANAIREEMQRDLREWRGVDPAPGGDLVVKRREYLERYEELTALTSTIASARGKPFFHFVQPNQYDRGSKPFSDEERRERVRNDSWFDLVTPEYGELRAIVARLHTRSVQSYDLTSLFSATTETVYDDDCCHLNQHGLEIMGNAMADRILASGALDEIAPRDAAR